MKKLFVPVAVLALILTGCTDPQTYTGYVHVECDPKDANNVKVCRATEMPVPTETVTVTATPTPTETTTPPPPPPNDGTMAATIHNWGPVVKGDEFNYTGAPDATKWSVYNSVGHNGNGLRSPDAWNVDGSVVRVTGDAAGKTGGMSSKYDIGTKYTRVETRMRTSQRDPEYHPVLILWPDSEWQPGNCPEIDYAEGTKDVTLIKTFLHWPNLCDNNTTSASKVLDTTQWHNYAVEWYPDRVRTFIDGELFFEDTVASHIPQQPMHSTIQLDWFPEDSPSTSPVPSWMEVDWTRVYDIPGDVVPPPPTGDSVTFAATGDMNPSGTTSATSDSGKNAASIKAALANGDVDYFLGLGDFQYSIGHCGLSPTTITSNDHYSKYHTNWGSFKDKTYWLGAPNHDYEPGRNDDLGEYMNGECVDTVKSATQTDTTRKGPNAGQRQYEGEWYSIDKGNWHILFAPTGAWRYNATRAQAMTAEMDADLKAAKAAGKHLAVAYHDPYFTSKTSSHDRFYDAKPWIDMFWNNRVKILFSGSQHNYERSCPVNNADQCVADGMQQFQVSTGGISLRSYSSSTWPSFIQQRFSDTWGHLRITLNNDGSYAWNFVPTSGAMKTDSGTRP